MAIDTRAHGHDPAAQSFDRGVPMCPAVIADKNCRVSALLAQPSVRAAERDPEVNVPGAIFRDRRAESARPNRRNLFPLFAAVQAAINTFAAGSNDESLGSRARQDLMHIGVIQPSHGRGPIPAFIVAHEQPANFDGGVKTARRLIVDGEKTRARAQVRAWREAAANRAEAHAFEFPPFAAVDRAEKRGRHGAGKLSLREVPAKKRSSI